MTIHNLKIEYQYAVDILTGIKSFEIRINNRDFKTGDLICFNVINVPDTDPYCVLFNMNIFLFKIIYITDYEQKDNYVVMSIKKVKIVKGD